MQRQYNDQISLGVLYVFIKTLSRYLIMSHVIVVFLPGNGKI